MPLPALIALLTAAGVSAKTIGEIIRAAYFGHKAQREFNRNDDESLKNTVQKKIEDFDWSEIIKDQPPVPIYGNHPNIKTLGGKSVLYDGNHSVSRWLFR